MTTFLEINCPSCNAETDSEYRLCAAIETGHSYACSRPIGHAGVHVACGTQRAHAVAIWADAPPPEPVRINAPQRELDREVDETFFDAAWLAVLGGLAADPDYDFRDAKATQWSASIAGEALGVRRDLRAAQRKLDADRPW